MDGDDLTTWTVWNFYVFYWQVYKRFQLGDFPCNLLPCIIGHLLTKNFQSCWSNAEEQPTASRVEEGTDRTHTIL